MGVCLCVHLSILNCGTDSGVFGASLPLSAELIRLRFRTCVYGSVSLLHISFLICIVLRIGCTYVYVEFLPLIAQLSSPPHQASVLLYCFLPPPVPDSTCCCGCHPIPHCRKVALGCHCLLSQYWSVLDFRL